MRESSRQSKCRLPKYSAVRRATSPSLNRGSSKEMQNVFNSAQSSCCASARSVVESSPPLRKRPTGTSLTKCRRSEPSSALRVKPADVNQWNGPYMPKDIPKDAWNRDFIYRFPGEHQADEPEIVSLGADGQPGGEGINADILSWKNK